ncbi:MAG: tetratricopeptide repeat protein, partial [Burkholderiaceae bacterium]|nr:tetratricopeptide repeat protein [Burkholderiaceae bacterium]
MFKNIASLCATILSALGIPPAEADDKTMEKLVVTPGDLVVQQNKNGWMAIKILAVDPWPDGSAAAHCLTYESVPDRPTLESLKEAPVRALHAPIDAGSFSAWERLGNQAPSKEDLAGFIEYLKLTDFPRYVAFTGQDAMEIVRKANEHYNRANALGEKGKRVEAIAEYSQAIELFPLYYEAIDNRAFTHMELGNLREALVDFEQSLRVYPDGSTAFFSKGECLMKLGELKAAEAIFEEG